MTKSFDFYCMLWYILWFLATACAYQPEKPDKYTVPLGKIISEIFKNHLLDTRIGHRALLPNTKKPWKSQRQRSRGKIFGTIVVRKNTKKINDFVLDSTLSSRVLTGFFVGLQTFKSDWPTLEKNLENLRTSLHKED